MKRVITDYSDLPSEVRSEFDLAGRSKDFDHVSFPHKGVLTKGVIFKFAEVTYLIKLESMINRHARQSEELDDDDFKENNEKEMDFSAEASE